MSGVFSNTTDRIFAAAPDDRWRRLVRLAIDEAKKAHKKQVRDDGSPYIFHPLSVALILIEELGIVEMECIVLALLHDAPELPSGKVDRKMIARLAADFGPFLSYELETLVVKTGENRELRDANYFFEIQNSSLRVKLVKLADRLHNLRSLEINPDVAKICRYLKETEKYVGLAKMVSPEIEKLMIDVLTVEKARLS